jgi:putative copper export protein
VRAVRVECAVAAVVLLITAALTGSEPPAAD